MLDSLYRKLYDRLNWVIVPFLLIGFGICLYLFECRIKKFGDSKALDSRFLEGSSWYNPTEVLKLFSKLEASGNLNLYAITELSLDLIFPVLYFLLGTFCIIRLFSAEKAKYLLLIPLAAALADISENFIISYLVITFNNTESSIAYLAAAFSLLKWILVIDSLIILILGAVFILFKRKS